MDDQTESSELSEEASARIDATIESVVEDGSASSKPADQQDSILSVVEESNQVLKYFLFHTLTEDGILIILPVFLEVMKLKLIHKSRPQTLQKESTCLSIQLRSTATIPWR